MKGRYDREPMLRLLECAILRLVGKLSTADEARLNSISTKIATSLGGTGPWYEVIAEKMELNTQTQDTIKNLWASYLASSSEVQPDAERFARQIADKLLNRG